MYTCDFFQVKMVEIAVVIYFIMDDVSKIMEQGLQRFQSFYWLETKKKWRLLISMNVVMVWTERNWKFWLFSQERHFEGKFLSLEYFFGSQFDNKERKNLPILKSLVRAITVSNSFGSKRISCGSSKNASEKWIQRFWHADPELQTVHLNSNPVAISVNHWMGYRRM